MILTSLHRDLGGGPLVLLQVRDGEHGGRWLWEELEHIYEQWVGLGAPARDRLLTVTGTGEHRYWLDTPDEVWWHHAADPAAEA